MEVGMISEMVDIDEVADCDVDGCSDICRDWEMKNVMRMEII